MWPNSRGLYRRGAANSVPHFSNPELESENGRFVNRVTVVEMSDRVSSEPDTVVVVRKLAAS